MKLISIIFSSLILPTLFWCGGAAALAIADGEIPGGPGLVAPPVELVPPELAEESLRKQILDIMNYFLTFLGLIAIIALIYFGFRLIVSGGDEEAYNLAKKGVLYVALGILLILLSYVIVQALIVAAHDPPLSG